MLSDEWLPRYRLLENFNIKWNGNGNGNAYDRGDYNSSFALRAVKLKTNILVSDLVRHDPGCTATADGLRLEILDLESRGIVLSI